MEPLTNILQALGRDLLSDLFAPFRSVTLCPALLTANDGVVRKLSAFIYAEQELELRPILADALEEAGCDNAGILSHLRAPGPHARGCWALDWVLGRQ